MPTDSGGASKSTEDPVTDAAAELARTDFPPMIRTAVDEHASSTPIERAA
ncbi:hypothetical protein NDI76_17275 [Halogeometricum sp. S1BR25-6]|uniref:Uncharacterized protein n=1 Tax=Halogeometricum salsisoli TaxID=2950536 RepID=A0ABU2GKA9_9EURY|nr:hypothetical protein [Halogeometricum sp. S1BR25-6]MDS0300503.1 hypothetical protein [Halogeometricum sp. S1BR25-6]